MGRPFAVRFLAFGVAFFFVGGDGGCASSGGCGADAGDVGDGGSAGRDGGDGGVPDAGDAGEQDGGQVCDWRTAYFEGGLPCAVDADCELHQYCDFQQYWCPWDAGLDVGDGGPPNAPIGSTSPGICIPIWQNDWCTTDEDCPPGEGTNDVCFLHGSAPQVCTLE